MEVSMQKRAFSGQASKVHPCCPAANGSLHPPASGHLWRSPHRFVGLSGRGSSAHCRRAAGRRRGASTSPSPAVSQPSPSQPCLQMPVCAPGPVLHLGYPVAPLSNANLRPAAPIPNANLRPAAPFSSAVCAPRPPFPMPVGNLDCHSP